MSLQFESLTLRNFGPFRRIDELDLATGRDAPIVVIHGENTLGKTSLFRALRWCLYGAPEAGRSAAASISGLREYMNRPALADGEQEMHVAIRFVADGQTFRLKRTASFDGIETPRVTADLRIDAEVIQQGSIEAEIGRQLHPQIADFFLFDGELLRDFYNWLNSDRERERLKSSIESVLGIPALQRALHDIGELTVDVMQRQTKALKNANDAETARNQLAALSSKQESLEKDRAEIQAARRKAESDLEDVRERIAGVDELKADAREMEGLESQIRGGEVEEAELRDEMRRLLVRGWLAPASPRLSLALDQVVQRNNSAQDHQRAVGAARGQVDLLQKRMSGGSCPTCEQPLPAPDSDTREALSQAEAELHQLQENGADGPDLQLERRIRSLIDESTIPAYRERQIRLDRLLGMQYDRNRRLGVIKDRLKDNDAAKIRQLGDQQEALEQAIEGYVDKVRDFDLEQVKISAGQAKMASALRRLGGAAPALSAEADFFRYVQDLTLRTIDRYKERTRVEVEQVATEMFMKLIRDPEGYEGIRIDGDYRLDLVGRSGPAMKTSEGGRQLIALSLIGALKRAAVRGGPVVLDSPLARLDLEHRANVLRTWVPELGSQAILLVQSGELTEAQSHEIMGSKIGHAYRIFRPGNDPEDATITRTQ